MGDFVLGNSGRAQQGNSAGGPNIDRPNDSSGLNRDEGQRGDDMRLKTLDPTPPLKTAGDVGLDDNALDKINKSEENIVPSVFAHESAGVAGVNENTEGKTWSSHPVQNFKIGPFRFEKSVLTLKYPKDIEQFEELLKGIPAPNRVLIKPIDTKFAGQIAAAHATNRATKSFDSSVGRAALERMTQGQKTIGDEPLDGKVADGVETFAEQGGHNENLPVTDQAVSAAQNSGLDNQAERTGEQTEQTQQ